MKKILLKFSALFVIFLFLNCSSDATDEPEMPDDEQQNEEDKEMVDEQIEIQSIIDTKDLGNKIGYYFLDLKGWDNIAQSQENAIKYFAEDSINGLRVSINGDSKKPAHPEPGVVIASIYDNLLTSINKAKTFNPDILIFASKKLQSLESFPDWVKDESGIIPEQYAIMIADYIEFMAGNDIKIDYLGIDNEFIYNEGKITPEKYHETIFELRVLASIRGFEIPILIGYEDFGPNKRSWVQQLFSNGWDGDMDIYGTHYYPQFRPKDKLIADLQTIGNTPFWATEPHWDIVKDQNPDVWLNAEAAIVTLWDQIDLGMEGFMWWNYRLEDNLRTNLMRAVSNPLLGATPIAMTDIDGADITQLGRLQSRAFIEDKLVTVYFLNMSETSYTDYGITFKDGEKIAGNVSYTQWREATSIAGQVINGTVTSDRSALQVNIPKRSITKIDIFIE